MDMAIRGALHPRDSSPHHNTTGSVNCRHSYVVCTGPIVFHYGILYFRFVVLLFCYGTYWSVKIFVSCYIFLAISSDPGKICDRGNGYCVSSII